MKQFLLAFVLLMGFSIAQAGFDRGNDLMGGLMRCEEFDSGRDRSAQIAYKCSYSIGYISAVVDAHEALQVLYEFDPYFCPPETGATRGQLRAIVKKYLDDNPAGRHIVAPGLVLKALSEAFPCE